MTLADLRALLLANPHGCACRATNDAEYWAAVAFFRRRVGGELVLYMATATERGVRFCYVRRAWPPKYLEIES